MLSVKLKSKSIYLEIASSAHGKLDYVQNKKEFRSQSIKT